MTEQEQFRRWLCRHVRSDTFKTDMLYSWFVEHIGAGPLDGGCVTFARALQRLCGDGEIVVIESDDGIAQHAALEIGGAFYDADGRSTMAALLDRWEQVEGVRSPWLRHWRPGDLTDSPSSEELTREAALTIQRIAEARASSRVALQRLVGRWG